jgi:hypothetical protein
MSLPDYVQLFSPDGSMRRRESMNLMLLLTSRSSVRHARLQDRVGVVVVESVSRLAVRAREAGFLPMDASSR